MNKIPEYHNKIPVIMALIDALYVSLDCSTGGCCHIVTDDGNIDNHSLKFVIDYTKEYPDDVSSEISRWICELLMGLSFEQRKYALVLRKYFDAYSVTEETWEDVCSCIDMDFEWYGI